MIVTSTEKEILPKRVFFFCRCEFILNSEDVLIDVLQELATSGNEAFVFKNITRVTEKYIYPSRNKIKYILYKGYFTFIMCNFV